MPVVTILIENAGEVIAYVTQYKLATPVADTYRRVYDLENK